jgi:beta-lactamase regulating signal transducer with metallopeptidase domain
MTILFLEAALRSLLMAVTVWAGIRLLRVSNVIAQKIAWSLVLVASMAMPFLVRSFPAKPVVKLPAAYFAPRALRVTPAVAPHAVEPSAPVLSLPLLQPVPPASTWRLPRPAAMLIPAYLGVSAILFLRICIGLVIAARIWHRAERASPILEPRATVRISSDIGSPVTIGSGVVLPDSYPEWETTKLRIVLAHERSHVRQADFYLQLLAGVYTAIFWFSPLGWWLQRKLADLGEAISDRAALEEAANRTSYAEVLLEFAAMPRRALAGVGMARSSNIQRRIDRLLTDHQFRLAFIAVRRHALIALAIVPLAMMAATSLVGIQVAEAVTSRAVRIRAVKIHAAQLAAPRATVAAVQEPETVPVIAPAPANAPVAPQAPAPPREAAPAPAPTPAPSPQYTYNYSDPEDGRDSYAIVNGDSANVEGSFRMDRDFEKARARYHGNYIFVERDGKSYVIDDPALVAKSHEFFHPMEELARKQSELGEQQARLGEEQARLGELQAKVTVPVPDLDRELAKLDEELKSLRQLTGKSLQMEDLADLQGKLGDLQGKLGELQGLAGEKQSEFGEKQGRLGEEQGRLGEQQGDLGEQQAERSKEANEKMKSLIDEALGNGKAKPVD